MFLCLVVIACSSSPPARADAQPLVLFFGGYGANAADMRAWKTAARRDPRYGPLFAFEAVPFPSGANDDERSAERAANAMIGRLAAGLSSTPQREVVLVGHSSGVTLAAAVLARLRRGDHVRLIALDGTPETPLRSPPGFRHETQFRCWAATNGDIGSSRRKETESSCATYRELRAPKCRTAACLHFWLVNQNAPLALDHRASQRVTADGTTTGYQNLRINLEWLRVSP